MRPGTAYQPTAKERWEEFKPYLGPSIAGLLLLSVGGWAGWRLLASETGSVGGRAAVTALPAEASNVAEETATWRSVYAAALSPGGDLRHAEAQLVRWLKVHRERAAQRGASPRDQGALDEVEAALGHVRSMSIRAASVEAEKAAIRAEASGDKALATQKWQESLRLQIDANAAATQREHKDLQRETWLARSVESAVAGPLREEVASLRAEGVRSLEARDWSAAADAFRAAREKQLQILEALPLLQETLAASLLQLEIDGETAASGPVHDRVRECEKRAAESAGRGDTADAAAAYEQAAALQLRLAGQHPRSRYATSARRDELETMRQTVLARPASHRATELALAADAALRRQAFSEAVQAAREALALLDQVAVSFPRARDFDATLRRRLEYLWLRNDDLAWVHGQVAAALAPLGSWSVSSIEVPQALYRRVMNVNPSRTPSPSLPVESISWHDARRFCERLSWLLGRSVRLPTEAEFQAMMAARRGAGLTAERAQGQPRAADDRLLAARTLQHVAGNVAEWLEAREESPTAQIGGASFHQDAEEGGASVTAILDKQRRSPFVGFRFVVESSRS